MDWLENKITNMKIEIYIFHRKIQTQYIFCTKIQEKYFLLSKNDWITEFLFVILKFWSLILKLNTSFYQ